jgi:hypothetical protein
MDARSRASRVRLIAFDIDGVMTNGGLCYTDDGHELKTFDVQDGLGLKLLQRPTGAGLPAALRRSPRAPPILASPTFFRGRRQASDS